MARTLISIGFVLMIECGLSVKAQLVVDAGGPRNSFYGMSAGTNGSTLALKGLSLKLDTAAQSVEALYFHPLPAKGLSEWLWGADLKFTAANGVLNLNAWPQTDLSGILNYSSTFHRTANLSEGDLQKLLLSNPALWSFTLRETPFFGQDPMFDKTRPVAEQKYTKNAFGNTVAGTFSMVGGGDFTWFSIALSAGYSVTNNYGELPKVTLGKQVATLQGQSVVTGGQVMRSGQFHTYNGFPLSAQWPINTDSISCLSWFSAGFNTVAKTIFGLFGSDPSTYVLIVSPYAGFTPRDLGKPLNAWGVSFVVRGLTEDTSKTNPNSQKLSFPISIFLERENGFSGKPSTTIGAGLVVKWP